MRTSRIKLLILAFLLLLAAAVAKDKSKPWTQWSMQDAQKILNDSPWAQTQSGFPPGFDSPDASWSVGGVIRLISAKPIRQAIFRTLELGLPKATPQQIADTQAFLDRKFDQTIVVAVANVGTRGLSAPLSEAFSSPTTAILKHDTFLELGNGKRAFLQEYQPPGPDGLGAMFIFPRMVDGALFITPKAGSVRFFARFPIGIKSQQSVDPFTGGYWVNSNEGSVAAADRRILIDVKFKITDFKYNGVLEY